MDLRDKEELMIQRLLRKSKDNEITWQKTSIEGRYASYLGEYSVLIYNDKLEVTVAVPAQIELSIIDKWGVKTGPFYFKEGQPLYSLALELYEYVHEHTKNPRDDSEDLWFETKPLDDFLAKIGD